ncbi:MAG TPA: TolC family outer membrane protein [Caulobacteraceae bacterium]
MSISRTVRVITALCGAGLAIPASLQAETLADAVALAYQSNPTLQGQRASQRALDESFVQAQAGYRPSASIQATVTTDKNNQAMTSPQQVFTPPDLQTSMATLTVTQPIYTGGLVASQVTAAEAGVLAGREGLRQVEETVLQNVIGAYVNVRKDQESLAISQSDVTVLNRELAETRARFEVGEITRTDVAETEAQVAASEAQLSAAQAQLASDRAAYAAVVGQNPRNLAPEPPLDRLLPSSIDQALDLAQRNNPQLRQADYKEQSSAAKVAEAKAHTRPTVDLRGSAGYTGGNLVGTPFANYSYDLTASAVLTIPLFTGGLTSSQIREAAENDNADRIAIETTRRQVVLAVAQAWNQLLGARAGLKSNEVQVRAANIAFEGTRQEAQVGLRTTLDVLITEQNLSNAELALVGARHDEYVAAAALLVAMGALYAQDLASGTPVYDPKTNFDKVRHSYPWAPWEHAVAAVDSVGAPSVEPPPPPAPIGR